MLCTKTPADFTGKFLHRFNHVSFLACIWIPEGTGIFKVWTDAIPDMVPPLHDLRVPSRTGHAVHLETSCFEMTARKQCFMYFRHRGYCFGCCFQLAISYYSQHLAPPLHNVYMVSGNSHTLDMAIHEHSIHDSTCLVRIVTSIVAALYPVDVPHGVCVL